METEPGIGYRFILVIDGYEFGGFSKIDGISASYEVTKVKEGGENMYVHMLPGRVEYGNITMTRALDISSARLAAWFTEYQIMLATAGRHRPVPASVAALSAGQSVVATWNFADIVPVKYTGPSFDASGSTVAIEKVEFAHHGFWSGAAPIPGM